MRALRSGDCLGVPRRAGRPAGLGVGGARPLGVLVEGGRPGRDLRAAGRRAAVVVLGPGEVVAEGLRLLAGGRGGEPAGQVGPAVRRVPLLAEHHVEAVAQRLPRAGARVERGGRPGVQRAGPRQLRVGGRGAVDGGEILEQRLHHVPRRRFPSFEARPHAVGVTLPEHQAPARVPVQTRQQIP
ncbi:hypothetical protein ACPCKL_27915 [Streptomyces cellulosae]